MLLPILTFPHKLLTSPCQEVSFPLSKEDKQLIKDMSDTVKKAKGIGLAAPQVGKLKKIIIIDLEHLGIPLFPLVNARVIKTSFKKTELEEGCLSIPNVFGMVKRPKTVTIEGQNEKGEILDIQDDGWIARVAQHEIDHTNGVLILSKIKKYTKGQEIIESWQKSKIL